VSGTMVPWGYPGVAPRSRAQDPPPGTARYPCPIRWWACLLGILLWLICWSKTRRRLSSQARPGNLFATTPGAGGCGSLQPNLPTVKERGLTTVVARRPRLWLCPVATWRPPRFGSDTATPGWPRPSMWRHPSRLTAPRGWPHGSRAARGADLRREHLGGSWFWRSGPEGRTGRAPNRRRQLRAKRPRTQVSRGLNPGW